MPGKRENTAIKRQSVNLGKSAHKLRKEGRCDEAEEKYFGVLKIDPDNCFFLSWCSSFRVLGEGVRLITF